MPHLLTRDGDRLHYFDVGRGPVCVLLHGFGMHGVMWLPSIAPLLRRWRFIIPDLRGFGRSHGLVIRREHALAQYADDLEDLLTGLNLDGCALAGLSMGACTSMEYQRRYGFGRVRAYLNIDNPLCVRNKDDWAYGLFGHQHSRFLREIGSLREDMLAAGVHRPLEELPATLRKRLWAIFVTFARRAVNSPVLRQLMRLGHFETVIRRVAPMHNWPVFLDIVRTYVEEDLDWRDSMAGIETPLWNFIGGRSRMYPPAGQHHFSTLIPQTQTVVFEGAGHALMFDSPRQFAREYDRFLSHAYA